MGELEARPPASRRGCHRPRAVVSLDDPYEGSEPAPLQTPKSTPPSRLRSCSARTRRERRGTGCREGIPRSARPPTERHQPNRHAMGIESRDRGGSRRRPCPPSSKPPTPDPRPRFFPSERTVRRHNAALATGGRLRVLTHQFGTRIDTAGPRPASCRARRRRRPGIVSWRPRGCSLRRVDGSGRESGGVKAETSLSGPKSVVLRGSDAPVGTGRLPGARQRGRGASRQAPSPSHRAEPGG